MERRHYNLASICRRKVVLLYKQFLTHQKEEEMKLKTISTLLGLLLCGTVTASLANPIISLSPSTVLFTGSGQQAVFDLIGDFSTDPTMGGGLDIAFDPSVVNFVGFTWNWTADDPALRSVLTAPGVVEIGFSNFSGISVNDTIGTVTFVSVGPGHTDFLLGPGTLGAGPLYSSVTYTEQTLDVHNAHTIMPLPGSAWLLGSALLGFVVVRRRL